MACLILNRRELRNPIPEAAQHDLLSECYRIVYHLELTDGNIVREEKFDNWDSLVEYIDKESPIFVEFNGVGATEFKIWTEMEDFSDKISDVSSKSENA